MNPDSQDLLTKAAHAIRSAELLAAGDELEFAAGRAYYAMFYAAKALLEDKQLETRKHSGAHHLFREHFVKPGLLEGKFHRWLIEAFNLRIQGDYRYQASITRDQVTQLLDQARQFLEAATRLLSS